MKKNLVYIVSVIVFAVSVLVSYFLQTNEFWKSILAIPAAGSLISILYKIWRDDLSHQRLVEIENKKQDFALATASHMAQVAYDKHVLFCEEYIERVQQGRQELFRDGPSRNALTFGRDLVQIRQRHSSWLTKEIEENLRPFEQVLIKIGAQESIIDKVKEGEKRNLMIEEIYKAFGLILGHEKALNNEEDELAIDKVVEKIRNILGINTLTELRLKSAELASKRLK